MKAARADHVIIDTRKSRFECKHCGEVLSLLLPMDVSKLLKLSEPFLAQHGKCAAPGEVAR